MPVNAKVTTTTPQFKCHCNKQKCSLAKTWQQRATPTKQKLLKDFNNLPRSGVKQLKNTFVKVPSNRHKVKAVRLVTTSSNDCSCHCSPATRSVASSNKSNCYYTPEQCTKNVTDAVTFTDSLKPPTRLTLLSPPTYTTQRSKYERLQEHLKLKLSTAEATKHAIQQQNDTIVLQAKTFEPMLLALQQFRLEHLNDCFTLQRQSELKMLRWPNVATSLQAMEPNSSSANTIKQLPLTPYALRQKLLQLRLQTEEETDDYIRKYAALDKSMALRFQA